MRKKRGKKQLCLYESFLFPVKVKSKTKEGLFSLFYRRGKRGEGRKKKEKEKKMLMLHDDGHF